MLPTSVEVNVTANPIDGGEVKVYDCTNGKYLDETECKHILYGTTVRVEATPASGNAFKGIYNGDVMVSGTQTYTFEAKSLVTNLEARFTDEVIWVRVKK